jgi:hypothetical protein
MKQCKVSVLPAWIKKVQRTLKSTELLHQSPVDEELYCVCNGLDTGQFMIQWDNCDEWFHGECVNMSKDEVQDEDEYVCPKCIRA